MAEYSLKSYFGGSDTEGYKKYKEGQKSGKWSDLSGYMAGGGGGGGVSLDNIPSVLKYAEGFEGDISNALKEYIMAQRAQKTPLQTYQELEEAAGLPGQRKVASTLRGEIGNVEDTLKRIEPDVTATTGESMVTEAQRRGIISSKQKPFLERLGELTTGLGRVSEGITAAESNINNLVGLVLQGNQQALEPLKLQYQALTDRAARLTSAFSADSSNQLQVLMAKWNRQNQLSDMETERAFSLLQSENSYKQELQKSAASSGIKLSGRESTAEILGLIGNAAAAELVKKTAGTYTPVNDYYETGGSGSYYGGSSGSSGNWWEDYVS